MNAVFPRKGRISKVAQLEADLGLELGMTRPPFLIEAGLMLTCLLFLIGSFDEWRLFTPLFLASLFTYMLAWRFGKELQMETVGDLARAMAVNHYFKLRPDPETINRNEFREIRIGRLNQNYIRESDRVTAESRF